MLNEIESTLTYLKKKVKKTPEYVLILGSGLGGLSKIAQIDVEIPYAEIPDFPRSTVAGHSGKLLSGTLHGKNVLIFQGRFHYYEGYSMQQVVLPIRVAHYLGADKLIVTNAAGGMNPGFEVGDIMLITDHINQMGTNPLIGPNNNDEGPRFPDFSRVYCKKMNKRFMEIAHEECVPLKTGVYVSVTGPTFETPAEYKYLSIIGGDAVGMSTVPEVIKAVHCGMKVMGFSVITDMGVGENIDPISHEEVQRIAVKSGEKLASLLAKWFERLN